MVEGNNAFGGGAGEVRTGTLVMTMVGAPAVPTRACVGAVTAVVPWILAVALEAVWVWGEAFLSFAQQ